MTFGRSESLVDEAHEIPLWTSPSDKYQGKGLKTRASARWVHSHYLDACKASEGNICIVADNSSNRVGGQTPQQRNGTEPRTRPGPVPTRLQKVDEDRPRPTRPGLHGSVAPRGNLLRRGRYRLAEACGFVLLPVASCVRLKAPQYASFPSSHRTASDIIGQYCNTHKSEGPLKTLCGEGRESEAPWVVARGSVFRDANRPVLTRPSLCSTDLPRIVVVRRLTA